MVYVISRDGKPLMPTKNHTKVRLLLKEGKAKVIKKTPFTIQLLYDSSEYTQKITLGVDAGSKHIGVSATTKNEVMFEADVELRNDITELLSSRKGFRKYRRNKLRYRKRRFNNRKKGNKRLSPSVYQKVKTHINIINKVHGILPVSAIVVEVANFDTQKLKNPSIQNDEYQNGEMYGFWNTREYVFCRDNYKCQCCKGKSGDKILNVHHIESRKIGGNAPNNLITLCKTCHIGFHKGIVNLPLSIKRGKSLRDAAFMNIMKKALAEQLKEIYPMVDITYGYITKAIRIDNNLPKDHYIDARCISGNPLSHSSGEVFYYKKIRCHNRQIHKWKIGKGNIRKRNQAAYIVKGFRLYDTVRYKGNPYIIFGRRSSGFFDIRTLDGACVNNGSVSCKTLKLIHPNSNFIIERRIA